MSRWKKACRSRIQEKLQLRAGWAGLAAGLLVDVLCGRNRTLSASFLLGGSVMWNHLGPRHQNLVATKDNVQEDQMRHKLSGN